MHAEVIDADAGEARFFTLGIFVGGEIEGLVFLERAAESKSALRAGIRLFNGIEGASYRIDLAGKGIARLERFIPEIAEGVAVRFIAATLGYNIDHAAARAPVLGVEVAEN